jgi:hypothetical protein
MGKIIAVVDQSDGADKTVAWRVGKVGACLGRNITRFNDLGTQYDYVTGQKIGGSCTIGVAGDSVGEFQALSFLKIAGIKMTDINIKYYDDVGLAVKGMLAGEVDAVPGWVPNIDEAAKRNDTIVLVSSAYMHTIYDVILESPDAAVNKHPEVSAFMADWFAVLRNLQNDPNTAAEAIANWQFKDPATGISYSTSNWTGVFPGTAQSDLESMLSTIAQASFANNLTYLNDPVLITNMLNLQRVSWEYGGQQLETPFDATTLFDSSYLQELSTRVDLDPAIGKHFVDSSFSPTAANPTTAPTADQLVSLPTVATFGCPDFKFQPNQVTIDKNTPGYDKLVACLENLVQVSAQADIQVLVTGSAAQPDPTTFNDSNNTYNLAGTMAFAQARAVNMETLILNLGFPRTRIAVTWVPGPVRYIRDQLDQDRWVRIEIKAPSASLH